MPPEQSSATPTVERLVRRVFGRRPPLLDFIHDELAGGLVLLVATALALVWANLAPGTYESLWAWHPPLDLFHLDLHGWVNDGLMALFFFVVGLEIKRELVVGELSSPRDAAMPVIAAVGGMVLPALLFLVLNLGTPTERGWGIPMATDIAFVLGALALLGSRAPAGLRLFLLAVAIVDDLGAIAVIAVAYSSGLSAGYLAMAVAVLGFVVLLRWVGATSPLVYVIPALVLWFAIHESGVHATVAGVAMGLLTPAQPVNNRHIIDDLQHSLHPFSALLVVPLFALANAGVVIRGDTLGDLTGSRVGWGIALGLVLGKTLGVAGAALLAQRLGLGRLPADLGRGHVVGGAMLAGIGFTVALFIAELSFEGETLAEAKLAILVASILAAVVGSAVLLAGSRPGDRPPA
ncbi:MAG: Na+/H+ antiporter NhaA [Acidimicrobiales bacterium]